MRRIEAILVAALVCAPRAAWPQGEPLGSEFRVNTYTSGPQYAPQVAADPSGNFVVVWMSYQDGLGFGVFGQRYASSGGPLGPEFRVNTYTTGYQTYPAIAADASGNFVVVWVSVQDGSGTGVYGQRYASSGVPLGPEFRVNSFTTAYQSYPSVAADASGNFVVAWTSTGQDAGGVFGQRYTSSGVPLGTEFEVNSYTTGDQSAPAVAADPAGNFVVVWASYAQDGHEFGVFGQRYAGSGAPLGPEFRVNSYTTNGQVSPSVAADSSGNFIVAWSDDTQDGSDLGVFGQRFAASGAPLGVEFRGNSYTTNGQYFPSVAADSAGNFVIAWQSYTQDDGAYTGVYAQRYAASGAPLGPEFRVNTHTPLPQRTPSVAADSSGNFVVVWASVAQDDGSQGVFGQRYGEIVPVELMRLGVE